MQYTPQIEPEIVKLLLDATVELTRLRQNKCDHLCVENAAMSIFANLLDTYTGMRHYTIKNDTNDDMFFIDEKWITREEYDINFPYKGD